MATGTRGAEQQEEQMATILGVLQEQGQRQERRYEDLVMQIEQLTQNQHQSWERLAEKQQLSEQRIATLEGQIQTVTEAAVVRIEAAEERIRERLQLSESMKKETDSGHERTCRRECPMCESLPNTDVVPPVTVHGSQQRG